MHAAPTCWQILFEFFQEETTEQLFTGFQASFLLSQGFHHAGRFIAHQQLPLVGWLHHARLQQGFQLGLGCVCLCGDVPHMALWRAELVVTMTPGHPRMRTRSSTYHQCGRGDVTPGLRVSSELANFFSETSGKLFRRLRTKEGGHCC